MHFSSGSGMVVVVVVGVVVVVVVFRVVVGRKSCKCYRGG